MTICVVPSLLWRAGITAGEAKVAGREYDGICSQTITPIAGAASQTGAGVASADGLCQPCSAGSRQSRQATRRSLAPPAFPQTPYDDLSSWGPSAHGH